MLRCTLAACAAATAATAAAAAGGAHEHGVVRLDVAVAADGFSIAFQAPLENLVGYERAPRSDAERRGAAEALERLRQGAAALFKADAAAHCTLAAVDVRAPVLEGRGGAREHADLDADYTFKCADARALRSLDVGLFDAFRRIQRIEVQIAAPQGQHRATLRRPARTLALQR